MVANKYITKIIAILMALAVLFCFAAMVYSDELTEAMGGVGVSMEYEEELFNTDEIISIDILMDDEEWEKMLSNALSEEYYVCDVVVNGVTFENVGIRPKGNTSLSSIAMDPDTDRYSLKLEFDHYDSSQTCFGLDKLILNNNYADATNMKEAIVYDMFQYLDADASLYNYASVSVNGEYFGVYLALEGVEQSFMLRNYGTQDGELYKPDSMEMGGAPGDGDESGSGFPGGFGGDFNPEDFDFENMPDMEGFDPDNFDFGDMKPPSGFGGESGGGFGGGPGGFSFGGGGANLNYSDDDLDSYQTIWDGAITDSGDKDHKRVVKALKNISEGTNLEEYLDIDNILKYMAVHAFVVNMDSLSGSMAHNYYLYEYNGRLNIIPWDYNLSLGGMGNGGDDATSTINDAIDTPFSSTEFFDALLENEEYLEKYHEYLNMLVEEYVYGGRFDEVYNRICSQIDELVETDPTAFYDYEEYTAAAEMLYDVIYLRADSVKGQLEGTIPSTDDGQKEDDSSLIDASDINLSEMGTMNMGGGDEGGFGPGGGDKPEGNFPERP
ncbi:MAG: CotH kinase family protein [Lachnospiraceae bacterium]|nr:CotH kinase family protein [Lachnospiraceae bacterium]